MKDVDLVNVAEQCYRYLVEQIPDEWERSAVIQIVQTLHVKDLSRGGTFPQKELKDEVQS